jgi:hypothetical protein
MVFCYDKESGIGSSPELRAWQTCFGGGWAGRELDHERRPALFAEGRGGGTGCSGSAVPKPFFVNAGKFSEKSCIV